MVAFHGEIGTDELLAALRLARSAEIGPITFHNLIDRFGSARAAIEELPALARNGGRAAQIRLYSIGSAERELVAAEKLGIRFLVHGSENFPPLLVGTEGAPPVLAVRGVLPNALAPHIAIVGARNASANGRKLAEALAAGLGAKGHIVVSGLARGIDAAAHRGALATGTVAVLAGGADQIYPEENGALYNAICESGAVLSEMPIGHIARAQDFPRRNRIIAGLALGTVIVEAAERSGSLITARIAGEMGREVFAVPGSPLDGRCRGTNQLLKDGAVLVETVDDILANLPAHPMPTLRPAQPRQQSLAPATSPAARPAVTARRTAAPSSLAAQILELISASPVSIDELVRQTNASASQVQAALFDLEIEGLIQRHPGPSVALAPAGST